MTRTALAYLMALTTCISVVWGQVYLTPLDFGLKLGEHGMIDYQNRPPNILVGSFDQDNYPDILRFNGSTLELFLFSGKGYPVRPQRQKTFGKPINSLHLEGGVWSSQRDLVVTLADGEEEIIGYKSGILDLHENEPFGVRMEPLPRRIDEFDFQIVWQSDQKPWGMNRCAVGDLDNDGSDEIASWWIRDEYADTAWIVIYKSVGDNQYDLWLEEQLYVLPDSKALSQMCIGDVDGNGQKELIYTLERCYLWEFDEAGNYTIWQSNFTYPLYQMVMEILVADVDQDSILELAAVTADYFAYNGTYNVQEYHHKTPGSENVMYFTSVLNFNTSWADCGMDVGDFDDDGRVDIVGGNAGFVIGYDPIELPYYTYDPTLPGHYQANWLVTGLPMSCVTPVIGDFDGDSQNELFAGGLYPNGGSAFLWKPTGFQAGYVLDVDTTVSPNGPTEAISAQIDEIPVVISVHVYPSIPGSSTLLLWSYQNAALYNLWQSAWDDSAGYQNPFCADPDRDGKKSIIVAAGFISFQLKDWEQTSAAVAENLSIAFPSEVALYPAFPNPFNNAAWITYDIPKRTDAAISIYDLKGSLIWSWLRPNLSPGKYVDVWKPENISSGIYFIQLKIYESTKTRKCILLK
jgi:hypothetical protein